MRQWFEKKCHYFRKPTICKRQNWSLLQGKLGKNSSKNFFLWRKMTTLVNISAVIVVQKLQLFPLPMWASLSIGSCGLFVCGPRSPHLPLQLVVLRISKRTHLFWFVINYIYLFSSDKWVLKTGPVLKSETQTALHLQLSQITVSLQYIQCRLSASQNFARRCDVVTGV